VAAGQCTVVRTERSKHAIKQTRLTQPASEGQDKEDKAKEKDTQCPLKLKQTTEELIVLPVTRTSGRLNISILFVFPSSSLMAAILPLGNDSFRVSRPVDHKMNEADGSL